MPYTYQSRQLIPLISMHSVPILSQATRTLIHDVEVMDERGRSSMIAIPVEQPLTIYVDKQELVTLMTLGAAPEVLTLGYLRNQRFIKNIEDILSVQVDWDVDAVAVVTRHGIENLAERTAQHTVTSGGGEGTVFGGLMDTVDSLSLPDEARLKQSTLYKVIESVRKHKSVYKQAGSLHGCALFSADGDMIHFAEDVGRHNAVDAIAGKMWLDQMSGADKIFYTTGRLTSEMVLKGAQMGIPFLLSRSGATQMGHMVAQRLKMSLFARCSGEHFLLLSGEERIIFDRLVSVTEP